MREHRDNVPGFKDSIFLFYYPLNTLLFYYTRIFNNILNIVLTNTLWSVISLFYGAFMSSLMQSHTHNKKNNPVISFTNQTAII